MNEKDLIPVKVHWEAIERYVVFSVFHLAIKAKDEEIGYYRIFSEPNSDNIAFYGKEKEDRRGILPPEQYKAHENNRKMIRLIEKDLEEHGYYIPDGHKMITDMMLIGKEKWPSIWEVLY